MAEQGVAFFGADRVDVPREQRQAANEVPLPGAHLWDNLLTTLTHQTPGLPPFWVMAWNSLWMAVIITAGKIVISILSAFAVVYFRFPFRLCAFWLIWNSVAPAAWRFDDASIGFTALTLMLSLQASYAAPLLLLAQNRQDDRDRVSLSEDRARAERNLYDTEYLTRELASLRLALRDVATRDYVRSELRNVLEELLETADGEELNLRAKRKSKGGNPQTGLIDTVQPGQNSNRKNN